MHPRIPWELVAGPVESADYSLGTTALQRYTVVSYNEFNKKWTTDLERTKIIDIN
jgi:hypothetical protein